MAVLPVIGDLSTNISHPCYVDQGVGPDKNPPIPTSPAVDPDEADETIELDVAMAAPSPPTLLPGNRAPSPSHSELPPIHLTLSYHPSTSYGARIHQSQPLHDSPRAEP